MVLTLIDVIIRLNEQDGDKMEGSTVTAHLTRIDADSTTGMVVPEISRGTADINGELTLPLWPNTLGKYDSKYLFTICQLSGKTTTYGPLTLPHLDDNNQPITEIFLSELDDSVIDIATKDGIFATLAANTGAELIGTTSGQTVQWELDNGKGFYEPNAKVILSTDTVTALDDFYYIYDVPTEITWKLPFDIPNGRTIVSISGDELTTNNGVYDLIPVTTDSSITYNAKTDISLTDLGDYTNRRQSIHIDGSIDIQDGQPIRSYGWTSDQGMEADSIHRVNVYGSIKAGWQFKEVDIASRGQDYGRYPNLKNITFQSQDATVPTMINTEAHHQKIYDTTFRGTKDVGVYHLELNSTLYNQVVGSNFGGKNGIQAINSNYPIATFYGLNASWFTRNIFNCDGTAFQAQGQFSFRDSAIENTSTYAPKMILGEFESAGSAMVVVDNIYFEIRTAVDTETSPLIELAAPGNYRVNNCFLTNIAAAAALSVNPTAVKSTGVGDYVLGGSCTFNYNAVRCFSNDGLNPANLARGFDLKTQDRFYYMEFLGNKWDGGSGQDPHEMIMINGQSVVDTKSIFAFKYSGRVYVRDEQHGEYRQNMPCRDVWVDHYTAAHANLWEIRAGRHILITAAPTQDVTVRDAEKWVGANFRVHFKVGCTLKQNIDNNSGWFRLAKGVDVVVPAGTVLEFVIDVDNQVREVGLSTMLL